MVARAVRRGRARRVELWAHLAAPRADAQPWPELRLRRGPRAGLYPIATSKHRHTALYQVSEQNWWLFF